MLLAKSLARIRLAARDEGFSTVGEHVDQRPFADLEADEVGHQPR
jgi:hypothetical protein